jgi:hypothetical protein
VHGCWHDCHRAVLLLACKAVVQPHSFDMIAIHLHGPASMAGMQLMSICHACGRYSIQTRPSPQEAEVQARGPSSRGVGRRPRQGGPSRQQSMLLAIAHLKGTRPWRSSG